MTQTRRLAAILAADVAGYSRLMGADEEGTVARLKALRAELIDSDAERATFEIECSSGTYIRTLIETLEDAYCETLRRTAIDDLVVPEESRKQITVEELQEAQQCDEQPFADQHAAHAGA